MNIALLGFGKMGQLVKQLATKKGHNITGIANSSSDIQSLDFKNVDVAIDFSTPDSAFENIATALKNNIPVVSGTTGWTEKINEIHQMAMDNDTSFLHASNFSIGVNIFFEINQVLNKIMKLQTDYSANIEEIHHTEKLDIPSGTALSLQSQLEQKATIKSQRINNIIGTHSVSYTSQIDTISIRHEAHNRNGFAQGAILAAEWIANKKGIFSMKDILNLNPSI
ncbi:MAG: dihydrodipicolinate reductase C-terminal domain-containing protein [Bacteroidota bacterium]|nr:dihydrodipicolinate reductase C-terminal domain-containing protein [Bacteroidota bacterium]